MRCCSVCPAPGHHHRDRHQPLCIAPEARTPTSNSPTDRKQEGGSRVPRVPPTGRPQLLVGREEVEGLVSGCAIAVGPGTSTQRMWGAGAGRRGDFRGAAGEAARRGRWRWAFPGARDPGLLPGIEEWARRRGAASGAGPKLVGSPAFAPDVSRETAPSPAEAALLVEVLVGNVFGLREKSARKEMVPTHRPEVKASGPRRSLKDWPVRPGSHLTGSPLMITQYLSLPVREGKQQLG